MAVGVAAPSPMGRVPLGLLLLATLAVSTAYGVLLLLPLYLKQLGGDHRVRLSTRHPQR
jgi:hypothetical protein